MPEKNAPTLQPKASREAYPINSPAIAAHAQAFLCIRGIGCDKPPRQNATKKAPNIIPMFVSDV